MLDLRDYQKACVDDCLNWVRKSIEPAVVDATVSFGKSVVIAAVAKEIIKISGKKVLVICPNGTLAKQNLQKGRLLNVKSSAYSASLNEKSIRGDMVVGTPQTLKNRISLFTSGFAAVLVDEGDGITPTLKSIVNEIRAGSPNIRIVGFTGTPYRLGTGYVYRIDVDGSILGEDVCRDPFYTKCIHRTSSRELTEQGYLTPVVIGQIGSEGYDTSALTGNNFSKEAVDRAYHGHGRKTAAIVGDIVEKSRGAEGVMIFAATVPHVKEVLASLPPEMSRAVYHGNPANQRNIADFKAGRFKYIVNVDMLTVGADFPHVSVLAVLRKTESPRLLTQIIGRCMRLHEGNPAPEHDTPEGRKKAIQSGPKPFALYLDYTSNIDDHFADGDLFAPEVRAGKGGGDNEGLKCLCPDCGYENRFPAKPDTLEYAKDENGYCLDLTGRRVETEWGPLPGHFGRRCWGMVQAGPGKLDRCGYRWTSKDCEQCGAANDIAARYCAECKAELVDPGEKLRFEFRAMKKDPTQPQCDEVVEVRFVRGVSQRGAETVRAEWTTPYRKLTTWHMPHAPHARGRRDWERFAAATAEGTVPPRTISYVKEPSGFYRALAFNAEPDHAPV